MNEKGMDVKRKAPLLRLYVPGNRKDLIEKSTRYELDAIIIDLEDAVPISLKEKSRKELSEIIPKLEAECLVRINNEPAYIEEDLKAVICRKLYGIVVPKAEEIENIRNIDRIITELERQRNLPDGYIKLSLSMESAKGVTKCYEIASSSKRIEAISCGTAQDGDLQRDLQCQWSAEGMEMLYARSKVLMEGRAAGIKYILDGSFSNLKDEEGLRKDSIISRRLGYDCRNCIHPRQLPIVKEVYSMGREEISYYNRMILAFEEAESRGLAAISFEGKLVDYAMYKKAKAFIAS